MDEALPDLLPAERAVEELADVLRGEHRYHLREERLREDGVGLNVVELHEARHEARVLLREAVEHLVHPPRNDGAEDEANRFQEVVLRRASEELRLLIAHLPLRGDGGIEEEVLVEAFEHLLREDGSVNRSRLHLQFSVRVAHDALLTEYGRDVPRRAHRNPEELEAVEGRAEVLLLEVDLLLLRTEGVVDVAVVGAEGVHREPLHVEVHERALLHRFPQLLVLEEVPRWWAEVIRIELEFPLLPLSSFLSILLFFTLLLPIDNFNARENVPHIEAEEFREVLEELLLREVLPFPPNLRNPRVHLLERARNGGRTEPLTLEEALLRLRELRVQLLEEDTLLLT